MGMIDTVTLRVERFNDEMNRKFCDRCGKEINTNPMMQCQNPLFEIRQLYPLGMMPIDLCEDCSKKFIEWIRSKEDGKND